MSSKAPPPPSGAKDKIAMARQIHAASIGAKNQRSQGAELPRLQSQAVPITLAFVVAAAFALILTDGSGVTAFGQHPTGISMVDRVLVGKTIPSLWGDADIDRLLVILIRGAAFFGLTGLVPLLAKLLVALFGPERLSTYTACWLVLILSPVICYVGGDVFLMLQDIIKGL